MILAAGKSKRMKSDKSKVLHQLMGKTLIEYVVEALETDAVEEIGLVAGPHNISELKEQLGERVKYILQERQLGTGHAVLSAKDWLSGFDGNLLVVVGDAPFLEREIVERLVNMQVEGGHAAVFLTTVYEESPPPYGRVVRSDDGRVLRIVEEKDADDTEKKIREVSTSHYCFDWRKTEKVLDKLGNDNAQGEYYLPDVIALLINSGEKVETLCVDDKLITFGINSREDMAYAAREMKERILKKWSARSVTIVDPNTTFIDATVAIGSDSEILPFTYLSGNTKIGRKCKIGPFTRIVNSKIEDNHCIQFTSVINGKSIVMDESKNCRS